VAGFRPFHRAVGQVAGDDDLHLGTLRAARESIVERDTVLARHADDHRFTFDDLVAFTEMAEQVIRQLLQAAASTGGFGDGGPLSFGAFQHVGFDPVGFGFSDLL